LTAVNKPGSRGSAGALCAPRVANVETGESSISVPEGPPMIARPGVSQAQVPIQSGDAEA
jgi:hypothetical protein